MENKIQNNVEEAKKKPQSIQDYIKIMKPAIEAALPSAITPERFTRMVLSAVSNNPTLASCTAKSFLGAMMSAAQLGVEPNTPLGQAYIIPYKNHGTLEAQFQLGYKGMIDLAYRSGEIDVISAQAVYSNDKFEYEYGLNPKLVHIPASGDRGEPVKYYAMFRMKSGGYGFEVDSIENIRRFAQKYSKSYASDSSPWKTNFDEMAKKTVLKRVLKYAPLKSEFARGVVSDETIKTEISESMYEIPDATVYDYEDKTETKVNVETGEVTEE